MNNSECRTGYEYKNKLYDASYVSSRAKEGLTVPNILLEARESAQQFLNFFGDLDLRVPDFKQVILEAYKKFESLGLFESAREIREAMFKRIVTPYGVFYVSSACNSSCGFCGAHLPLPGEETRGYFPKSLSAADVVNESLATMLQGHTEACLLQGDVQETSFSRSATEWLPDIVRVSGPLGLKKLVLNVQTLSPQGYVGLQQLLVKNNRDYCTSVALNCRTFQETYDYTAYRAAIPNPYELGLEKTSKLGRKFDFKRRRATQATAHDAGIEGVGMGLLLGVSPKSFKDLFYLIAHQQQLLWDGVNVERVAIPSAHNIEGLNTKVPYDLGYGEEYQKLMEMLYATFRILADPSVSLVMSERDDMSLLKKLVQYADHTTVGVHPEVGGNLNALLTKQFSASSKSELDDLIRDSDSKLAKQVLDKLRSNKDLPVFTQANVSSVLPSIFIKEMDDIGFTVQLSRDETHLKRIKAELSQRLKIPITTDDF